jgi:hypothetical protein
MRRKMSYNIYACFAPTTSYGANFLANNNLYIVAPQDIQKNLEHQLSGGQYGYFSISKETNNINKKSEKL